MGGRLQPAHKLADSGVLRPGDAGQILGQAGGLHHVVAGAAAAVTEAIGDELTVCDVPLADIFPNIFTDGVDIRPAVGNVEMGQHLGAVDPFPGKGVVGERIGLVPGQFGGQEIPQAAALHDLGDSGRIAEGVRLPEGVRLIMQIVPKIPLAFDKLANQAFAAGHVAVAFDPGAAVWLPAALSRLPADPLVDGGVIAAHPVDIGH